MCTCMKFQLGVLDELGVHVVLVCMGVCLAFALRCMRGEGKEQLVKRAYKSIGQNPGKAVGSRVRSRPAWAIAPDTTPGRLRVHESVLETELVATKTL